MRKLTLFILVAELLLSCSQSSKKSILVKETNSDTVVVQTFTFNDSSPEGWNASYKGAFEFPSDTNSWEKILMVRTLKCDPRTKADKNDCGEWDYLTQTILYYNSGEKTDTFQLGSFVTPYGNRLKLGDKQMWTWVYDVTDYAPILHGWQIIESGNNQELLDMKFLFIKGTPMRDVISVENLYSPGLYVYENLADDKDLKEKQIVLNPDASGFMLRARISGHGHNGPRNCCEWDSKTHSYIINDWDAYKWQVWKDCGFNPIYPQGGTWPFDRAGWCPGTKVDEYDFELTKQYFPGDSLKINYEIEHYKENGEKKGEFVMSHQLFSYGSPNFDLDARIEDILIPSNKDAYKRMNPTCENPIIVIRNSGKETLKSLCIDYGTSLNNLNSFHWEGNLDFLETESIVLPQINILNQNTKFHVYISYPNNQEDGYENNNYMTSNVVLPDSIPASFIIRIKTNDNNRARENSYFVRNNTGVIVSKRESMKDNTEYIDTLKLEPGCYQFSLIDKKQDGMNRHWWEQDKQIAGINGEIEFLDINGKVLKEFPYDFGEKIEYSFMVSSNIR